MIDTHFIVVALIPGKYYATAAEALLSWGLDELQHGGYFQQAEDGREIITIKCLASDGGEAPPVFVTKENGARRKALGNEMKFDTWAKATDFSALLSQESQGMQLEFRVFEWATLPQGGVQ